MQNVKTDIFTVRIVIPAEVVKQTIILVEKDGMVVLKALAQ